ncbi:MAG TPA: TolC family protein, partial [Thermoanaerobaculia bacterium]|nr:TolC family protein [Thermoanaerobaculia bacterium]
MRFGIAVRTIGMALVASWMVPAAGIAQMVERPLTLTEAIALALENNEGIRIERALLESAEAGILGAQGAYDPLVEVEGGWRRSSLPVNSSFSGAPSGQLAPTTESFYTDATVSQLLPTGARAAVRGSADRGSTDGVFDLLSPSYGTGLGFEVRQPLLRDRRVDAARIAIRVAAA